MLRFIVIGEHKTCVFAVITHHVDVHRWVEFVLYPEADTVVRVRALLMDPEFSFYLCTL